MKGGYTLIDLKKRSLTTTDSTTIAGIYDAIEKQFDKATLLTNIVIDSIELDDTYVHFEVSGTDFVGSFGPYQISVSDEDVVTITALECDSINPIAAINAINTTLLSKMNFIDAGEGKASFYGYISPTRGVIDATNEETDMKMEIIFDFTQKQLIGSFYDGSVWINKVIANFNE